MERCFMEGTTLEQEFKRVLGPYQTAGKGTGAWKSSTTGVSLGKPW